MMLAVAPPLLRIRWLGVLLLIALTVGATIALVTLIGGGPA